MADCPGVLHLAEMADGGLARIRTPGGRLTASQARAVADLAGRLGSGVIDLTNRANLQIRGLPLDAGAALSAGLLTAGLFVDGPADRQRNILLDPLAGLDPVEVLDLRPIAEELERALIAAPWIEMLSPKFSFVLDGGGRSGVSAMASDVGFLAFSGTGERSSSPLPGGERSIGEVERVRGLPGSSDNAGAPHPVLRADLSPPGRGEGRQRSAFDDRALAISLAGQPLRLNIHPDNLVDVALAIARMAADAGPDARGRDLSPDAVVKSLLAAGLAETVEPIAWPSSVRCSFGIVETSDPARQAVAVPVAVGRLDPTKLGWLAAAAERQGDGTLVLAPWSAVVLPGVAAKDADSLLAASERAGFPPVAVVERLTVIACAGAPSCVRALEPAKAIGLALLSAAAERPELLPPMWKSVHVSACAKGCAASAPADLLLLGSSAEAGFSLHTNGAPRRPGRAIGRADTVEPLDVLARLRIDV